ncbi:hypothetical protein ATZ36_11245 [Candidatus Endomicrobiellum trichonymphae]|uniref:Uncharacterized protein n=1 Tax=Endomicrobium trichonymphae TaxID=1408204 RepID=A0A1E5IFC6_ENDTX|nr:hypothetical protein ATZ36_11245 [Candidatus Endomicrobium trichonymphae]
MANPSKYKIEFLKQNPKTFIDKWYFKSITNDIDFVFEEIKELKNSNNKNISTLILSRTMRPCRATLAEPVSEIYYCSKCGKICKPVFSIMKWWRTHSKDTIKK